MKAVVLTSLRHMELTDLTQEERLACVTLIQHIIMADSDVSELEMKYIDRLAFAFGEGPYRKLLDEAETHLTSEETIMLLTSRASTNSVL